MQLGANRPHPNLLPRGKGTASRDFSPAGRDGREAPVRAMGVGVWEQVTVREFDSCIHFLVNNDW
ncbi:MAG: hypothetical protein QOH39_1236 [Verrucomicrobiota bacterium]|jgi:hypothetical protein